MIPLLMVVDKELGDRPSQRCFAENDHAVQTRFLDRANESLGVSVQIWRPRWQSNHSYARLLEQVPKRMRVERIAIQNQIPDIQEKAIDAIRHIAAHLVHPLRVRILCDSCQVDPTARQFDEKEHVIPC